MTRAFASLAITTFAVAADTLPMKSTSFDTDPKWESVNNIADYKSGDSVTQDFGYSSTSFASSDKGEIGGITWRAVKPAWYAMSIQQRTLNDKLTATGTFAITDKGGGGVVFGWFNSNQQEGTSRPLQSLALQIGTSKNGGVLHVRLHSPTNESAGMLIPPKEGRKEHGTYRNDGTRYRWQLDYDPQAAEGRGRISIVVRSNLPKPESFEGKTFSVELPEGMKAQGTAFDRFGMMSLTKPGGKAKIYFGDLTLDGRALDLRNDPRWEAVGNRATTVKGASGANEFGYSTTHHAGGGAGEIGGTIWRTGKQWASYADRVGPLSLNDTLEARGKVMLEVGAPDSGALFGWFKSRDQDQAPDQAGSFIGVRIAGPSRAGHYFAPAFTTAKGTARAAGKGPLLVPGRVYEWSLRYDSEANNGLGSLRAALGDDSFTFDLKKGDKAQGGEFDRFGLFSIHNDGGHAPVKIWFDDMRYTSAR